MRAGRRPAWLIPRSADYAFPSDHAVMAGRGRRRPVITIEAQVLLMDEPCPALDPISTLAKDLISQLKRDYTIVIVTHHMQQAARVSDRIAFFNIAGTGQPGRLVDMAPTQHMFNNPDQKATEDYISGRFG